jgi:hypothetical protein
MPWSEAFVLARKIRLAQCRPGTQAEGDVMQPAESRMGEPIRMALFIRQ